MLLFGSDPQVQLVDKPTVRIRTIHSIGVGKCPSAFVGKYHL
jgi:hypothetical protein